MRIARAMQGGTLAHRTYRRENRCAECCLRRRTGVRRCLRQRTQADASCGPLGGRSYHRVARLFAGRVVRFGGRLPTGRSAAQRRWPPQGPRPPVQEPRRFARYERPGCRMNGGSRPTRLATLRPPSVEIAAFPSREVGRSQIAGRSPPARRCRRCWSGREATEKRVVRKREGVIRLAPCKLPNDPHRSSQCLT